MIRKYYPKISISEIDNNARKSYQGLYYWKYDINEDIIKIFPKYKSDSHLSLNYYLEVTTGESSNSKKWNKEECLERSLEIYNIWHGGK